MYASSLRRACVELFISIQTFASLSRPHSLVNAYPTRYTQNPHNFANRTAVPFFNAPAAAFGKSSPCNIAAFHRLTYSNPSGTV